MSADRIFMHPEVKLALKESGTYFIEGELGEQEEIQYENRTHEMAVNLVADRLYYKQVTLKYFDKLLDYLDRHKNGGDSYIDNAHWTLSNAREYAQTRLTTYDRIVKMLADDLGVSDIDPDSEKSIATLIEASKGKNG